MADQPQQNSSVQTADDIIKGLIYDVAVNAFVIYAQTQLPFLSYPLISSIFKYLVGLVADHIYTQLDKFVAFQIIDLQTTLEQNTYQTAVAQLQQAQAKGDPDALNQAKQNFKDTLGHLIHLNG